MANLSGRTKFFPVILILLLYNEVSGSGHRKRRRHDGPATEFSSHRIIEPRLFHGRSKREIATTRDVAGDGGDVTASRRHLDHLTVTFDGDNDRRFVLDLKLNRQLIPENYFQKTHKQVRNVFDYLIIRQAIQTVVPLFSCFH